MSLETRSGSEPRISCICPFSLGTSLMGPYSLGYRKESTHLKKEGAQACYRESMHVYEHIFILFPEGFICCKQEFQERVPREEDLNRIFSRFLMYQNEHVVGQGSFSG